MPVSSLSNNAPLGSQRQLLALPLSLLQVLKTQLLHSLPVWHRNTHGMLLMLSNVICVSNLVHTAETSPLESSPCQQADIFQLTCHPAQE